jgi:hypothetical protein
MMDVEKEFSMTRITTMCFVCAVLLFAIVVQTPSQFVKKTRSYFESSRTKTVMASTAAGSPNVEVVEEAEMIGSAVRQVAASSISIEQELHLRNSPNGPVVAVLQKGAVVEPRFEVQEAGRKWAYVRIAEQNLTGFLEDESLQSKTTAHR